MDRRWNQCRRRCKTRSRVEQDLNVDVGRGSDGFLRVVCTTADLRLVVLPELGAKIATLLDRRSGRDWIAAPSQPYRRARLGDAFEDFDRGGWDECFPNLAPGAHPDDRSLVLYDHGEVWSRPWDLELAEDAVTTTIHSARLGFTLSRRLRLVDDRLELSYQLVNERDRTFRCAWAPHPLFAIGRRTRIVLPGVERAHCDLAADSDRFGGDGAGVAWPIADADGRRTEDISLVGGRTEFALKIFTENVQQGVAALLDEDTGQAWIALRWDAADCPYVGVWINEGGWPAEAPLRHVALEPTCCRADRLDVGAAHSDVWTLDPGEARAWHLGVRIGSGRSSLDLAL